MNSRNREKLKSFILLMLLTASIIQVGILWSYQNHGFPISFIMDFFGNNSSPGTMNVDDYLKPYRVVVSSGDESYWILDYKGDTYNRLWNDIKTNYLARLLTNARAEQVILQYNDEWDGLISKKAVILDFKTNIESELLLWSLNPNSNSGKEISGIYKILISPWEDVNNNLTFYVTDGIKVCKFILPYAKGGMTLDDYGKIFDRLQQNDSQREYSVRSELGQRNEISSHIGQDVLFILKGSRYNNYYDYTCYTPDVFKIRSSSGISSVEKAILADDNDLYDYAESNYDDSLVFKNMNNFYRVHRDGLLDYKYISSSGGTEKAQLIDAFKNAVDFISKRKQLVQGVSIYLSGINNSSKNYIDFTFDYMLGNIPVFVDYNLNRADDRHLHNAITIRANSKRVVNAWWIIKRFEQEKTTAKYNVNFVDFIDNGFKEFTQLKENKKFFINDINISYVVKTSRDKQLLEPTWVVSSADGKFYIIPAEKKQGG